MTCSHSVIGIVFVPLFIVAGGCGANAAKPAASRQPTSRVASPEAVGAVDCSSRLHDVCGALLLYYFTYRRLPATLDEVNTFPGADATIPLTCPTSGLPYVYDRDGIQLAEKKARVIAYDPTPAHGGRRLAIRFVEPTTDERAIVVDVIALSESFFLFRPPVATTLPAN